jgi:hypothetical protein
MIKLKQLLTEGGLYHIGYNKGRGQGKGVFKDSYSSYKDAKKAVEKLEKERGGSYNMVAYYVADKDGNFVRESVNEEQPHQKEMIDGIVEMLVQVKDIDNRKQMALDRLRDFKKEGIEVNADEFMERCGLGEMNEKWSASYKRSIDCNNPKGFSQRAHCQGRKKREVVEEAMQLFLEKNCPTDPAKWSASKAAAKGKFDVYPSAYANGWAAKNYKSKGGGWKTCK